jgi:hypothetical protein
MLENRPVDHRGHASGETKDMLTAKTRYARLSALALRIFLGQHFNVLPDLSLIIQRFYVGIFGSLVGREDIIEK